MSHVAYTVSIAARLGFTISTEISLGGLVLCVRSTDDKLNSCKTVLAGLFAHPRGPRRAQAVVKRLHELDVIPVWDVVVRPIVDLYLYGVALCAALHHWHVLCLLLRVLYVQSHSLRHEVHHLG